VTFIVVGCASVLFERALYSQIYGASELDQVLLTIGLAFMAIAAYTYFYGPLTQAIHIPDYLTGEVRIGSRSFPTYRAFLIVVGAVLIAVLWYLFDRTTFGAKIRAAVDNRRMAQSVGINVDRLFTIAFAIGSGLAALGGGLSVQLLGLTPSFAVIYLVFFLLVVAVGGSGSMWGTLAGALVLGISDTAGKYLFADAGSFCIYAVAVVILLIKPAGLYGRE
jgi:branched-chain amino acid transport system permease protein